MGEGYNAGNEGGHAWLTEKPRTMSCKTLALIVCIEIAACSTSSRSTLNC